jgi:hypothetical protein
VRRAGGPTRAATLTATLCRAKLYCYLTRRLLNRKREHVDVHVQGRRYRNALAKCKAARVSRSLEAAHVGDVGGRHGRG